MTKTVYEFAHRGKVQTKGSSSNGSTGAAGAVVLAPSKEDEDWLDKVCAQATHSLCPVPKTRPADAFDPETGMGGAHDNENDNDNAYPSSVFGGPSTTTAGAGEVQVPPRRADASVVSGMTENDSKIAAARNVRNDANGNGNGSGNGNGHDQNKDTLDRIFEQVESVVGCGGGSQNDDEESPSPSQPNKNKNATFNGKTSIGEGTTSTADGTQSRTMSFREKDSVIDSHEYSFLNGKRYVVVGSLACLVVVALIVTGSVLLSGA